MSMQSAALNTVEILEDILLLLPPKDLFVLQRVCMTWRNTIRSSKIASASFVKAPMDEATWAQPDFEWNPLLLKHDRPHEPPAWCCRLVDTINLERLAGNSMSSSRQLYLTKPARTCVRISYTEHPYRCRRRDTQPLPGIGRTMTNLEGVRLGDLALASGLSVPCAWDPSGSTYFNVCVSGGLDGHELDHGVEIGHTGSIQVMREREKQVDLQDNVNI